ncbi:MAG: hypothetical protein HYU73_05295 [Betaproteobacteria bacterium]|nr:hypothetical protein [Betaproteobacteria bacterium]
MKVAEALVVGADLEQVAQLRNVTRLVLSVFRSGSFGITDSSEQALVDDDDRATSFNVVAEKQFPALGPDQTNVRGMLAVP